MSSSEAWLGGQPRRATLAVPALLTRTSSRPYSASIHSAARWIDLASVTSSWTKRASIPASRRACSAWRPSCSLRAPASTVMPGAPSWRAVSNPMPLLAPVIRAIFVVMPVTLWPGPQSRERPADPGTGDTTLPVAAGGKLVAVTMANRAELAAFLRARRARVAVEHADRRVYQVDAAVEHRVEQPPRLLVSNRGPVRPAPQFHGPISEDGHVRSGPPQRAPLDRHSRTLPADVTSRPGRLRSVRPAGPDQARLVGEDDQLGPVSGPELGHRPGDDQARGQRPGPAGRLRLPGGPGPARLGGLTGAGQA